MEGVGPAVPASFVHGVREVGEHLQLVGIGVLAHPVELEDLSRPAMVGVLQDGQPVGADGTKHTRTAILGDTAITWVCALLPDDAQQLHQVIARAAERVMRHEAEGTVPRTEPHVVGCFLPDELRWTQVGVTIEREDTGSARVKLAVVLRMGADLETLVAAFGAPAAQVFASQIVKCATKARKAKPL